MMVDAVFHSCSIVKTFNAEGGREDGRDGWREGGREEGR
jgi:hypothetical protein